MERWIEFLDTFRTNSMAEFGFRVIPNIGFHLSPIALVIADLLARRTDREKATQYLNFFQGLLTISDRLFALVFDLLSLQREGSRHPYSQ
jgi:hypothetical protein